MNERTITWARRAGTLLLAYLGACGGRYDIGDVANGGAGGTSGATNGSDAGGTGGSGTSAAGGSRTTDAGGSGAVSGSGTTAGATSSGGSSTGTRPSASRTMNPTCVAHAGPAPAQLSYGTLVTPDVLAQRITTFLQEDPIVRKVPNVTTPETAADVLSANLAAESQMNTVPAGLVSFVYPWLQVNTSTVDGATVARVTGAAFAAPNATLDDVIGAATWTLAPLNSLRTTISSRGSLMSSAVFCATVGPPPVGINGTVTPNPRLTERQNLEAAVSSTPCINCHLLIDPLGDSLANFDATGTFRDQDENGNPLDASGIFTSDGGQFEPTTFTFTSIDDLAPQFVDSCEAVRCFTQTYTSFALDLLGLPPLPDDELDFVVAQFTENQLTLESLLRAFVQTPTFLQADASN